MTVLGLSCGMQDLLIPWPGIELGPPALGSWSLSQWTTREVPKSAFINCQLCAPNCTFLMSLKLFPGSSQKMCPCENDLRVGDADRAAGMLEVKVFTCFPVSLLTPSPVSSSCVSCLFQPRHPSRCILLCLFSCLSPAISPCSSKERTVAYSSLCPQRLSLQKFLWTLKSMSENFIYNFWSKIHTFKSLLKNLCSLGSRTFLLGPPHSSSLLKEHLGDTPSAHAAPSPPPAGRSGWDVALVGSALVLPVLRKFMCVLQLRGDLFVLLLDNTAACAWWQEAERQEELPGNRPSTPALSSCSSQGFIHLYPHDCLFPPDFTWLEHFLSNSALPLEFYHSGSCVGYRMNGPPCSELELGSAFWGALVSLSITVGFCCLPGFDSVQPECEQVAWVGRLQEHGN